MPVGTVALYVYEVDSEVAEIAGMPVLEDFDRVTEGIAEELDVRRDEVCDDREIRDVCDAEAL